MAIWLTVGAAGSSSRAAKSSRRLGVTRSYSRDAGRQLRTGRNDGLEAMLLESQGNGNERVQISQGAKRREDDAARDENLAPV